MFCPHSFYVPERLLAPSRVSNQMLSHKDPSSQINVISTNGDEMPSTQNPSWHPDCHPPRQQRKYTEIIKSHSRGSMTAYKFCSCHFQEMFIFAVVSLYSPQLYKDASSITSSATVAAQTDVEHIFIN